MDDRESTERRSRAALQNVPSMEDAPRDLLDSTGSFLATNEDLLSGTGTILKAASTGALAEEIPPDEIENDLDVSPTPSKPRYVRQRTPHRSQGTLDDLAEDNESSLSYTHDSNISIGGATPLSGMAYRRSRSNMSRVKNGTRYGQYLEIPKGRRSIFASRERARRRRSVLALLAVVFLLVMAALFLWNMMQQVLN